MSRSDYIWDITKHDGHDVLSITDLNRGRMSVTNNMEHVISEIERELELSKTVLPDLIVYRDSCEIWDAWDNKKEDFILLDAKTNLNAKELLIKHNEKKINADRS